MNYQGIELSKKQSEWVRWYQKGSNDFWEAFYEYSGRKTNMRRSEKAMAWFNTVLKSLKEKGLFLYVPFAFYPVGGIYWVHPGFENSGHFKAESLTHDMPNYLNEYKPIL